MNIFIVYPVHLFEDIALLRKYERIFILEDPLYFTSHTYHTKKLILHRASMKNYETYLKTYCKTAVIKYIEHNACPDFWSSVAGSKIHCYDPVDHDIRRHLAAYGATIFENPGFITTMADYKEFNRLHGDKKFRHDSIFYRWQRDRLGLVLGDKLTYDHDNRGAFPTDEKDVFVPVPAATATPAATKYVVANFKSWGSADDFVYPIDHATAKHWLTDFIHKRLAKFGIYQDAMSPTIKWGYHSVLSPLLNIGLLTDHMVIQETLKYARRHDIPINSLEGFLRQVIGWKAAVRYMYEFHYNKFAGRNALNHKRRLPAAFWNANTGIPPVDDTIKKLHNTGYLHHIERLMIMGNFMLLCNIKPSDVYEWFMLTIDAYPWVMVANVLGMSQFADGGFFMTRPYFSSSNYIQKQSHGAWKKGEWNDVWDALYYAFINKHATLLAKNYSTASAVGRWKSMPAAKKKAILSAAEGFLRLV